MRLKGSKKRKLRVRFKVVKRPNRPRLSVFRSNTEIYVQVIDDTKGKTLAAFSSEKLSKKEKTEKRKTEIASLVGEKIAALAKKAKVKQVVFDRGGYKYHGRVKALAEAARKGGLKF